MSTHDTASPCLLTVCSCVAAQVSSSGRMGKIACYRVACDLSPTLGTPILFNECEQGKDKIINDMVQSNDNLHFDKLIVKKRLGCFVKSKGVFEGILVCL